jgi:hypothetical protein
MAADSLNASVAGYLANQARDKPIQPALISNPMAETNWRSVAHNRLVPHMSEPAHCVSTPSVSDLPKTLHQLFFQRHCNILILNGGDGTIHHTLNALLDIFQEEEEEIGMPIPLPRVLFVNGGGMNMVARAMQTRGHPVSTLRHFLRTAQDKPLGHLATRSLPLLEVNESDGNVRRGFVFGSHMVMNALTMYERFGRGYRGLSRFFKNLTRAYLLKDDMWQSFKHLIVPPETPLTVDDRCYTSYAAVAASTIPMTLLHGLVRTLPEGSDPGKIRVVKVHARTPRGIIGTIPFLMAGKPGPGFSFLMPAERLTLMGPYTLDGELFSRVTGEIQVRGTGLKIEGILLR